jgi:hypothetical protein
MEEKKIQAPLTTGVAASRWSALDMKRGTVLNRARTCAAVTLPFLLPPEGTTEDSQLKTPYQSVGARAVNNLASKLMLTLYPPNSPYFKMDVDRSFLAKIEEQTGDAQSESKIKEQFALLEAEVIKFHEDKADRVPLFNVLRSLIVTGNSLVLQDENSDNRLRYFRMDQYVVRRNPAGRPVEIVVREYINPDEVPEGIIPIGTPTSTNDTKLIELYTYCKRVGNKWHTFQETMNQIVPDSEGTYTDMNFPFLPLAWTLNPGENYGRGHVEENLGDFLSLEGLRKAFLEGAAALAKLVFLVNPNGLTKKSDVQKAPNGGYAVGRKDDITVLQAEKMADFQFVQSEIVRLEGSLSKAFLLAESVQRQAERVTAEEIRMMAADIDDTLGGIYTLLSQDLQFPLLLLRMEAMRKAKKLPPLPKEVAYTITTGFEALGRGHEIMKLQQFLNMLVPLGPDTMKQTITTGEYARRVATGLGLNIKGLVPTDEEMAQAAQQMQMMGLIDKVAPILAKVLTEQMAGGGGAPTMPEQGEM